MHSWILFFVLTQTISAWAETAPGAPGKMGSWGKPDKSAFGTTLETPVWFTLNEGSVAEVFYPYVDRVQTRETFLVILGEGSQADERHDFRHEVRRIPGTLAYEVLSWNSRDHIYISKTIQVHTKQPVLILDYRVQSDWWIA